MNCFARLASFAIALAPLGASATAVVVTNAAALKAATSARTEGVRFSFTGTIVKPCSVLRTSLLVFDGRDVVTLTHGSSRHRSPVSAGDTVHVAGVTVRSRTSIIADCHELSVLAHGPAPAPADVTLRQLHERRLSDRPVRLTGIVRDVFGDEIDENFAYVMLATPDGIACASYQLESAQELKSLERLVGSRVALTGFCIADSGNRRYAKTIFALEGLDAIKVLAPESEDPFAVPDIATLEDVQPSEIAMRGPTKATGTVIAIRQDDFFIRTESGEIVRSEVHGKRLPRVGVRVDAVGFPSTDLFTISLSSARWRTAAPDSGESQPPRAIRADEIAHVANDSIIYNSDLFGQAVRLSGYVRRLPEASGEPLQLESDGHLVWVDMTGVRKARELPAIGCQVSVTGICIFDCDNWRPETAYPKIRGYSIVTRSPDDFVVLARPPWWTTTRLLTVTGALLATLLGAFAWNLSLRRRSERRGAELAAERVARAATDMKVLERTRLAVELHDSLSQTLTGVSMELESATQFAEGAKPELRHHLDIVGKALKACRNELRDCLWDLRNQSLEESEMNTAISRTILPHVKDVKTNIRFNIPRERFSENTIHVILRIVRELTVNAIKHGKATFIQIAGGIEGDTLKFSVTNNGLPFDPANSPGVMQGHFGIAGMKERLQKFSGTLAYDSPNGRTMRAKVTLHLSHPDDTLQP